MKEKRGEDIFVKKKGAKTFLLTINLNLNFLNHFLGQKIIILVKGASQVFAGTIHTII